MIALRGNSLNDIKGLIQGGVGRGIMSFEHLLNSNHFLDISLQNSQHSAMKTAC